MWQLERHLHLKYPLLQFRSKDSKQGCLIEHSVDLCGHGAIIAFLEENVQTAFFLYRAPNARHGFQKLHVHWDDTLKLSLWEPVQPFW